MAGALSIVLVASACVSTSAYVENGHDEADFRDLQPRDPPTPVRVITDFRVNGEKHPEVNRAIFNEVIRVLQGTRVLMPVSGDPGATLTVAVDDSVDLSKARNAGLITGLTEGLVGSVVKDEYNFTYTLKSADGGTQTGIYRHGMFTVSGHAAPSSYGRPHSSDDAFSIIVKQSVLDFLSDIGASKEKGSVMIVPDAADSSKPGS